MTYSRYKAEILASLDHASKAAHEGHVRNNDVPGYRPQVRKECDLPLCAAIRKARDEARAI